VNLGSNSCDGSDFIDFSVINTKIEYIIIDVTYRSNTGVLSVSRKLGLYLDYSGRAEF